MNMKCFGKFLVYHSRYIDTLQCYVYLFGMIERITDELIIFILIIILQK